MRYPNRQFIGKEIKNGIIIFEDKTHKHIFQVLKYKNNDNLVAIINKKAYLAKIENNQVLLVEEIISSNKMSQIHLFNCLLQRSNWEIVLEKVSEIGVSSITPVISSNSITINQDDAIPKYERWNKIVDASIQQSRNNEFSQINEMIKINDLTNIVNNFDQFFVANENESKLALTDCKFIKNQKIGILIGPEKGFTPKEIDFLISIGIKSITLGPSTLKAETASIVAISLLKGLTYGI